MRRAWKGMGLSVLLATWVMSSGCLPEAGAPAAAMQETMPAGLIEATKGHETGDMLPTNDATFQLQLSRLPSRFIVHMRAPRDAVALAVSAYFRNLGVEDLAMVNLMWCESLRRGAQAMWSCNR